MIAQIIDLLKEDNYYRVSREVDIAKGKFKLPSTYKELKNVIKRNLYGR